jgi:hypothetical protein
LIFHCFLVVAPPVVVSRIVSTASETYTIFWDKPTLPAGQTVLKYFINYRVLNGSNNSKNVSNDMTSIAINVEYEKQYIFEIQVVTEPGISNVTSRTWFSHSGKKYMKCFSTI